MNINNNQEITHCCQKAKQFQCYCKLPASRGLYKESNGPHENKAAVNHDKIQHNLTHNNSRLSAGFLRIKMAKAV